MSESEWRNDVRGFVQCPRCEWEGQATVVVDTYAGVACAECRKCGKTFEPT